MILVSCVSVKSNEPTEAQYMYQSAWFKKARHYVLKQHVKWGILSAKYGLLSPYTVIQPYNMTLLAMSREERIAWANRVFNTFHYWHSEECNVTILAGSRYREFLQPMLERYGYSVHVPLQGLGIGQQLHWFDIH